MNSSISKPMLAQLSQFVAEQMGLHFPTARLNDLERGLRNAAREFGFNDPESCRNWLMSSTLKKDQIDIMASHLTVGETYFFRDKRVFEVIEHQILPELIDIRRKSDRHIRIWSAGCASGEEPYSIAILLNKMIPDKTDWNLQILATDINPGFLQKAAKGEYGKWSFRDVPAWVREGYFKKKGKGRFEISADIKKLVKFSYHNLAKDAYPSLLNNTNAMDIILCRNVLMYFKTELINKIVHRLYRCLVNGGRFFTGPSESFHAFYSPFVNIQFPGVSLYQKDSGKPCAPTDFFAQNLSTDIERNPISAIPKTANKFDFSFIPEIEAPPSFPFTAVEIEMPAAKSSKQDPYAEALKLYMQGSYSKASEGLIDLVSNDRDASKAISLLVRIYANQGRLSEALTWCDKGITRDKLNGVYYYLRSTILQEKGEIDDALRALKQALYVEPDFILAQFAMGNLTRHQGKIRKSEKHFKNTLALLNRMDREAILPESDGVTAGRLIEMIGSLTGKS